MLSSITPLGERGRNNRFVTAASFFVVGSVLGGMTTGAAFGLLGAVALPAAPVVDGVVIALLAVVGAGLDARVAGMRLPTIRRQVDERWLQKYRGWVYGLGFGFQLGTGVATIVSSAAVYLMVVAAMLTRSVAAGVAIGAVFGTVRGLSILLARRVVTYDGLRLLHRRIADNAERSVVANVAIQGLIGAVALVAVVSVR